jgi:3-isopropylmalate dehydrogenase
MARAQAADAVLLAAVGGPKWDAVPYEVGPEAGLLRLRKDMNLFANLRPAICYPALADASSLKRELVDGLDLMVVRELTGGVYFGEPKQIIDLGNGQKRAIDTQDYHTYAIERIGRVAFELAGQRRNTVPSSESPLCARGNPMSSLLQSQTIPKDRNRYDKTDQRFKGMINLAATAIALK